MSCSFFALHKNNPNRRNRVTNTGGKIMTTKFINKLSILTLAIIAFAVVSATAQTYELRGATNRQLRTLIDRIENGTDAYKREMQSNSNFGRTANQEDRVLDFIQKFEDSTDRLKQQADSRRPIGAELTDVFDRAQTINQFMIRNRLTGRAESLWSSIRNDLNTLATYYQYSWSWDRTVTTYPNPGFPGQVQTYELRGVTYRQFRMLINRIENGTDAYKREMQRNSSFARTENQEERILDFIQKFEDSTDRLKQQADSRRPIGIELTDVFARAQTINQFMIRNRMTGRAESLWASVRTDLNTLATYYQYSWNWDQTIPVNPGPGYPGSYPGNYGGGRFSRLVGTYRLNTSRSDDVSRIVNTSIGRYDMNMRDNVRRNLERRLASPEMIAIDLRGREIEMATSNSNRVSFTADGTSRTETNPRGRTVTTTATLNRGTLQINYKGDRMNDFYVTFDSNGDQLVVTKRIYLEDRNDQVTVRSVYDRVSGTADWTAVNAGPVWNGGPIGGNAGNDFYVPNGTRLTATLNSTVSTSGTQVGDRFTMTVDSPGQYRGAVIEGHTAQAQSSGRLTGRANVSLEFDTISMNGRTYRFAGIIDSVTAANGDRITVNNEGTIRDTNQTQQTVARAGVGAVLGAIIGAIAGGGQGAAIGAGVGAGVGAGSVLITGRDTIELGAGSTFGITAYSPGGTRIGSN